MKIKCAVCGVETERKDFCIICRAVLPGGVGLEPEFREGQPLVWKREPLGVLFNVRWRVRHHSPSGMEIGYPGSGSADLALNAMAAIFPPIEGEMIEKCFDGTVSHTAWRLHQDFKFKFLAEADRNEGRIAWDDIIAWMKTKHDELAQELRIVRRDVCSNGYAKNAASRQGQPSTL